jgi:hypothetical protein
VSLKFVQHILSSGGSRKVDKEKSGKLTTNFIISANKRWEHYVEPFASGRRESYSTNYSATIEPMLLYAIEAWYPMQSGLQTSVERFKKVAAKLCVNDIASDYKTLLSKLSWKPLGQLAMERRATQGYKYARKVIDMTDDTISLQISLDATRSDFSIQLKTVFQN